MPVGVGLCTITKLPLQLQVVPSLLGNSWMGGSYDGRFVAFFLHGIFSHCITSGMVGAA